MRRAFLSLPLLVAFALLKGCGGSDADSSAGGAGAGGEAGFAAGAAGKAGAGGAGTGSAGTSTGGATAGSSGAAGGGGTSCGGAWATIPGVPKDWVPFSTPDCGCTFYVPPAGASVAPIEWEPCPLDGLQDVVCQRMKTSTKGEATGVYGARWSPDPATIQVLRGFPPGPEPTRAELVFDRFDGGAPWAVAMPYRSSCRPVPYASFDGRYAIGTSNDDTKTNGVVAGMVGQSATVTRAGIPNGDAKSGWGASADNLYRDALEATWASAWTAADGDVVYKPELDPDSAPGFLHYLRGGDAFLKITGGGQIGFASWSATAGLREILRFPHDNTRGFMHLGSDGKVLAFTYGEAATSLYEFSKTALFVAPYTTDPVVLKANAKPLTAIPRIAAPSRWGVGCGYAAAGTDSETDGVSLLVVRLSDGAWWRKWPKNPLSFGGIEALGVTCDEVIATAGKLALPTRVRIDSLGDPSPPVSPDLKQPPF